MYRSFLYNSFHNISDTFPGFVRSIIIHELHLFYDKTLLYGGFQYEKIF